MLKKIGGLIKKESKIRAYVQKIKQNRIIHVFIIGFVIILYLVIPHISELLQQGYALSAADFREEIAKQMQLPVENIHVKKQQEAGTTLVVWYTVEESEKYAHYALLLKGQFVQKYKFGYTNFGDNIFTTERIINDTTGDYKIYANYAKPPLFIREMPRKNNSEFYLTWLFFYVVPFIIFAAVYLSHRVKAS